MICRYRNPDPPPPTRTKKQRRSSKLSPESGEVSLVVRFELGELLPQPPLLIAMIRHAAKTAKIDQRRKKALFFARHGRSNMRGSKSIPIRGKQGRLQILVFVSADRGDAPPHTHRHAQGHTERQNTHKNTHTRLYPASPRPHKSVFDRYFSHPLEG